MIPKRAALLLVTLIAPAAAAEAPLVDYVVENAASIPAPLVEGAADPAAGAAVFDAAGCAGCHGADAGPDLAGVGARLSEGAIRLAIVNPAILWPETAMPAYYAIGRLGEVPDDLVGRTRLSAGEVEALVAWLAARKD